MEKIVRTPVVMSWSGGKDSAMALHELLRSADYEVLELMATVSEEYRRISHHGVREELLDAQAAAIGIPLAKLYLPSGNSGGCTNEVYEGIMNGVMDGYKARGVTTVAFGDLFLEDLRAWREANLAKAGMRGLFPIWKRNTTADGARGNRAWLQSLSFMCRDKRGKRIRRQTVRREILKRAALSDRSMRREWRISFVRV